jgi:hypothetical protein
MQKKKEGLHGNVNSYDWCRDVNDCELYLSNADAFAGQGESSEIRGPPTNNL